MEIKSFLLPRLMRMQSDTDTLATWVPGPQIYLMYPHRDLAGSRACSTLLGQALSVR